MYFRTFRKLDFLKCIVVLYILYILYIWYYEHLYYEQFYVSIYKHRCEHLYNPTREVHGAPEPRRSAPLARDSAVRCVRKEIRTNLEMFAEVFVIRSIH